MGKPGREYWERLSEAEFIFENGCWKACDSFCCRWCHPDFNFKIIPGGGTLFYMEEEYSFMSRYKLMGEAPVYTMSLGYGGKKALKLFYKHCDDCDNCNKLFSRSLYCKLYPFLPVFDIDGNIKDVKYISVYDVTLNIIKGSTPCSVTAKRESYMDMWKKAPEALKLLKEPYVLFNLRIADLVHDNYVKTLSAQTGLISMDHKDFWRRWEMEYLAGRLVDQTELSKEAASLYKDMALKYGEFV